MHIHKFLFLFLLQGCYLSHELTHIPIPMGDAGPSVPDAGPITTDASIPMLDAGPVTGLDLEVDDIPAAAILIAGGDTWHRAAQLRLGPEQTLASICVILEGDAADIADIAVGEFGRITHIDHILGQRPSPFASSNSICIEFEEPFVTVPLVDGDRYPLILVRIPYVVSNATSGGEHDGWTMSGDRFRIAVTGADYIVDGVRAHADLDPIRSNEFQIRKSVPMIERLTISTTALANGNFQELYRFRVSADEAGSIGLGAIVYNMVSNGDLTFSGFGLFRGPLLMGTEEYDVLDESGNNLEAESLALSSGIPRRIDVMLRMNEIVSSDGMEYTLRALTSGVEGGDSVSISFDRIGNGGTGYLMRNPLHPSSIDESPWGSPEFGPVVPSGFTWSDLSEVPHVNALGLDGGSRDWIDAFLIEDLTQSQTLSR